MKHRTKVCFFGRKNDGSESILYSPVGGRTFIGDGRTFTDDECVFVDR